MLGSGKDLFGKLADTIDAPSSRLSHEAPVFVKSAQTEPLKRGQRETEYTLRDKAFSDIFNHYKNRPEITQALQNRQLVVPEFTGNPIDDYLAEATSYPLLDRDEETQLFSDIEAGHGLYTGLDETETELNTEQDNILLKATIAQRIVYASNMRLAFSVAKNRFGIRGGALDKADHLQEADIGLLSAINRYDPFNDKGAKFGTYAHFWITQRVGRSISDNQRTIRIPAHLDDKYNHAKKQLDKASLNGERITPEALEKVIGMNQADYRYLRQIARAGLYSLDAPLPGREDGNLGDLLNTEKIQTDSVTDLALDALSLTRELSDSERFVVGLQFGLSPDDIDNPTFRNKNGQHLSYDEVYQAVGDISSMKEIASIVDVSYGSVRNISAHALRKLRESYQDRGTGAP